MPYYYFPVQTTLTDATIHGPGWSYITILQMDMIPDVSLELVKQQAVPSPRDFGAGSGFQPLDSDLTAIAALATTTYGRALLTLANDAALCALLAGAYSGQAGKSPMVDGDEMLLLDSAATGAIKRISATTLADYILAAQRVGTFIAGLSAKNPPVSADALILADSADGGKSKYLTYGNLYAAIQNAANIATVIGGQTAKSPIVSGDEIPILDSAASGALKRASASVVADLILSSAILGGHIAGLSNVTPVLGDYLVIADASDSGNAKYITITQLQTLLGAPVGSTYTPTLTNVTNVTSSTAGVAIYQRVDNTVSVDGYFDATPTANNWIEIGISLPVSSNLGAATDLSGLGMRDQATNMTGCYIKADTTNDRASFNFYANASGSSYGFYFHFKYKVI